MYHSIQNLQLREHNHQHQHVELKDDYGWKIFHYREKKIEMRVNFIWKKRITKITLECGNFALKFHRVFQHWKVYHDVTTMMDHVQEWIQMNRNHHHFYQVLDDLPLEDCRFDMIQEYRTLVVYDVDYKPTIYGKKSDNWVKKLPTYLPEWFNGITGTK